VEGAGAGLKQVGRRGAANPGLRLVGDLRRLLDRMAMGRTVYRVP
jgi:hypothetical protein